MRSDHSLLRDIVQAADDLAEMIQGRSLLDVSQDKQLQYAMLHALTVIGEATGRVSQSLRDEHPDVPWSKARSLRNRIVHEYFGVDWDLLWRTAVESIPAYRAQVSEILRASTLPGTEM